MQKSGGSDENTVDMGRAYPLCGLLCGSSSLSWYPCRDELIICGLTYKISPLLFTAQGI